MPITVTFNSAPDAQQFVAWLIREALAWFLSLPGDAALSIVAIGCFVVLAVLFLLAEQMLTWGIL